MKKNTVIKSVVTLALMLVVSTVGFGEVFGYGGGSSRKSQNRSETAAQNANQNAAFNTTNTAPGQVLGESDFKFSTYLSEGTRSNDVKELQEKLRALGFFTFHTSTGYFGPITLAAVKAFQTANGIPSTGFVGPLTIAALNK